MVAYKIAAAVCSLFASLAIAAPDTDLIDSLPLWGRTPTPQYSGYLNATDGCDTAANGPFCKLHYWLATADDDAANKPVIVWLNGGPGSSSVLGFLQENGPLLINATGGLMMNPWSWTQVGNLLILESPVGVGYSYCAHQLLGKVCKNTDRYTASAARAALVDFYDKFPEYKQNDLFITGESYAGVYIPTLAKEILDNAPELPLRGLAVGDPCTDNTAQADSMDALWYSYKYGLVDEAVYDMLWNKCDVRIPATLYQSRFVIDAKETTLTLTDTAYGKKHHKEPDSAKRLFSYLSQRAQHKDTPECTLALRKFLMSTSRALSQDWRDSFIDDYSLFAPVSNLEDDYMTEYMNRRDVKLALHVTDTPVHTWPYPNAGFDYTKEYDACNDEVKDGLPSMIALYNEIVPKLKQVFVYNGDTDPCVSYEGTRTAIARVGFAEVDGGSYRPWFYNHTETTGKCEQTTRKMMVMVIMKCEAQYGMVLYVLLVILSLLIFVISLFLCYYLRSDLWLHIAP
jgi:serine carboxypeptidase-like clade I